jgi:hypothetical protein
MRRNGLYARYRGLGFGSEPAESFTLFFPESNVLSEALNQLP